MIEVEYVVTFKTPYGFTTQRRLKGASYANVEEIARGSFYEEVGEPISFERVDQAELFDLDKPGRSHEPFWTIDYSDIVGVFKELGVETTLTRSEHAMFRKMVSDGLSGWKEIVQLAVHVLATRRIGGAAARAADFFVSGDTEALLRELPKALIDREDDEQQEPFTGTDPWEQ